KLMGGWVVFFCQALGLVKMTAHIVSCVLFY
ncbi:MAG: hypothetical protein ACI8UG_002119, partial [Gammaproteobacteria bacterium]